MNTPPVERKLAAILSADVAGYSRLMGIDEAATLAALGEHRQVIDELIGRRGGRIVSTAGDSVLAEFPSLVEAVHCAVEIQQAMTARNADVPEERKMLLRIGINVDDVMQKDEDIFGHGVNVAARLQGLASPGGICISRAARDQLRDKSPFVFDDHGEHAVKNIARPVRVYTVRFEGTVAAADSIESPGPTADSVVVEVEGESNDPKADETELAFWNSIMNSEAASDYAAYLERYPAGNFSNLARARISSLTAGESTGNEAEIKLQITYWESVKDSDDPAMFRAYLEKYPEGHFKELAAARLAQLTGEGSGRPG
jgi:class 3 adenylate cyclase